jgi:hypothetical protein
VVEQSDYMKSPCVVQSPVFRIVFNVLRTRYIVASFYVALMFTAIFNNQLFTSPYFMRLFYCTVCTGINLLPFLCINFCRLVFRHVCILLESMLVLLHLFVHMKEHNN